MSVDICVYMYIHMYIYIRCPEGGDLQLKSGLPYDFWAVQAS